MAEIKTPGLFDIDPEQEPMNPMMNQAFATPGTGGFESDSRTDHYLESEKEEIILDMTQFIFDLTGMVEPTPFSDGTNALISVARGNWLDALISVASIVPYVGDLAKLGKLQKYLNSIRKAVKLAGKDSKWGNGLRLLFIRLKKLVDELVELLGEKVPDELLQIKHELDEFLPSSMDGAAPGGKVTKPTANPVGQSGGARTQRVSKPKEVGDGGKRRDIIDGDAKKNVDPPGTFRDSQGRLRNENGSFAKDPNTVKFSRSAAERRKALLRDAKDPNSGLSDRARKKILDSNGNNVPKGHEVDHTKPLYTKKTIEGKRKLDKAENMKTMKKSDHRKLHKKCNKVKFHKYPPNQYN